MPNFTYTKNIIIPDNYNGNFKFVSSGFQKNYDTNRYESLLINDFLFESNNIISESGLLNNYDLLIKNFNSYTENSSSYTEKEDYEVFGSILLKTSFPLKKVNEYSQNYLKPKKILRVPGAYNPLTAKLIEEIGYDAVYVSGGVMANDLGFPDIGLTTLQDVSTRSYLISRVTNLPTIVDIDTGFKSCEKTIQVFEEFGVAAVHLEDQIERKRCGHLDNKELISKEEMVNKIKKSDEE